MGSRLRYCRTLDGIRDEVFAHAYRLTDMATGDILIEFGAAHIDVARDLAAFPPGSVCLDLGERKNAPSPLVVQATPRNAGLVAAIKAMLPADARHMQRHDNGCGAAVIAYLNGETYTDAVRRLYPGAKPRATGTQRLAAETGTRRTFGKLRTWAEAAAGEAVAALIKSPTAPARRYGHYVAIDPDMTIVDPELVEHYPLDEYPRRDWRVMAYFARP